jgi:VWFA-related protein
LAVAVFLLSLFLLFPAGAALAQPGTHTSNIVGTDPLLWPEPQRAFLQDGPGLLLTPEQRTELRSLDEAGRDRFIKSFLADEELAEGIARRQRLAGNEIFSPTDVRWQIIFLNGPPKERLVIDCGTAFKPIEVWAYPGGINRQTGKPANRDVVVYRPGPGQPFRLWVPSDSKRALYTPAMEYWLEQWEELRGRIQAVRFDLQTCRKATERIDEATGVPGLTGAKAGKGSVVRPIDVSSFLEPPSDLSHWAREAASAEVPAPPPALKVQSLDLRFPERDGQRMRMRALLQVPAEGLELVDESAEKKEYALTVQAMLEQEGKPFEEVRIRYKLPPPAKPGEPLALALDRWVRPDGLFLLRLQVEDETSGARAHLSRGFRVPRLATPDPTAAGVPGGELVPETVQQGPDSLVLLPPPADVVLGLWRADALITGSRIKKVVFLVDGTAQLTRTSEPYSAELRLSKFPTEQMVRAEGYDEKGNLVAADEVIINQPRGALGVWVTEPPKGAKVGNRAHVKAEVMIPDGRRIESLDFKLNDEKVGSLTKPPWQMDLDVPAGDLVYVTVAATLDDGTRAEAVRYLRSPEYFEELEVNLVELYVTVNDRAGLAVTGLTQDDFEVYESGKPQEISKFELVSNLPLTVGILLDTSGSMAESLSQAQQAAAEFLKGVIKPKDKAFAVSFSSRTRLDMPPTDDAEAVATALSSLQAVGDTALHDAIIHSLYYFRGMKGQRALILLSDGDDNASYFPYKDALEYAQRSGVALYVIGYNLPATAMGLRSKLNELAGATGGKVFLADEAKDLPGIYAQIEKELRSRYLVAYNSNQTGPAGVFREVEVRLKKKGLTARTMRGYYQ